MAKPKPHTLSALALAELQSIATAQSVAADELILHACESARNFSVSTYFTLSPWFKKQPHHDFEAFIIRRAGAPVISQRMVIDMGDRRLLSHVEHPLDDYEYYARRIIEEVLVDQELEASRQKD